MHAECKPSQVRLAYLVRIDRQIDVRFQLTGTLFRHGVQQLIEQLSGVVGLEEVRYEYEAGRTSFKRVELQFVQVDVLFKLCESFVIQRRLVQPVVDPLDERLTMIQII